MSKTKKKLSKVVEQTKEGFQENLKRFEDFLNVVRGKVDVKSRLMLLLNPDNIKTSTRLSRTEVDFVALSHFVAQEFPEFEGLREFANQFCECAISKEGLGREEAIRFTSAISESKLLKSLGIFKSDETKVVKGKV